MDGPIAWLHVVMQLQDSLQAFLLQLEADGRSPHTIGQYRRHVGSLVQWVGVTKHVDRLKPDVVARFFAADVARNSCRGGRKKAVSLNAMRTSIRCFCAHLHDAGLVSANPARLLRRARCAPPPPKALRADEQSRLLDALKAAAGPHAERDRVLVELLLGTGIRIGSALALDVEDIDFEHGELTLRSTKNNRPATAIMSVAVGEVLREFVGERTTGPLFVARGKRISTRHAQRRLAGWLAEAGIEGKSAHSFRHSFATGLLAETGDLRLVQAAMHHASIVSTTIYAQVDRSRLREAVGA